LLRARGLRLALIRRQVRDGISALVVVGALLVALRRIPSFYIGATGIALHWANAMPFHSSTATGVGPGRSAD
jgi:hypothetical protein